MTLNYQKQITEWLAEHKSTTVPAWLKRNPDILDWVMQSTQQYAVKNIMESVYIVLHGAPELCSYGNKRQFNTFDLGYRKGCVLGNQCRCVAKLRLENQKTTLREKYGVETTGQVPGALERRRKTMLDRYGVEYAMQSTELKNRLLETVKARTPEDNCKTVSRRRATMVEKFGVEHHMQLSSQREKVKTTNLERYGVEFPLQNTEINARVVEAWKQKTPDDAKSYVVKIKQSKTLSDLEKITETVDTLFDRDKLKQLINSESTRKKVATQLGVSISTLYLYINKHNLSSELNKTSGTSSFEIEVGEFIEGLDIIIERNNRTIISPRELDIWIPSKKIAVECCGLYWHSENSNNKDKQYHFDKFNKCREQGITLITIFEDEWKHKPHIVKKRLTHILGTTRSRVSARKCHVQEISSTQANEFVEQNHLQGAVNSKINLALFYDNHMVAVMTFGIPRYSKKYDYELLRFCLDQPVVGAASKLFKHFQKNYSPNTVISYSDNRWGTGSVYGHLGFDKHKETTGYFYTDYFKRFNRNHFQKYKLVAEGYDPSLSEWEIAQSLGYDRIWDCGQSLWVFTAK